MRTRLLLVSILSVFVLALVAGRTLADDAKGKSDKPAAKSADPKAAGGMTEEEMMKKWMEASTPGQPHAQLKAMEGNWNFTSKMRMDPSSPWEEDKGTANYRMILGGRFIEQEMKGTVTKNGLPPFEGFGLTGYDNMKKQFVNFWFDTWSTAGMTSVGKGDESGKTITMTGECDCPIMGKKTHRMVTRILSSDKMVFEMYTPGPDGKEFLTLEVAYAKK